MKQMILSVGREFGSGGRHIAQALSEYYDLPFYDRNMLDEIARRRNLDGTGLKPYDEKKPGLWMSGSPAHSVAQLQFEYLREKADIGESFVVVGRCSESLLRGSEALISIFVHADLEHKILRIMERNYMTRIEAEEFIRLQEKRRREYHDAYSSMKWGDARSYDIAIDSGKLGIDGAVEYLKGYIAMRRENDGLPGRGWEFRNQTE